MPDRSLCLWLCHLNCALKTLLLLKQENNLCFLCQPELGKTFSKAISQGILEENVHEQYN